MVERFVNDIKIIASGGKSFDVILIDRSESFEIPELKSNQEEADTRLILRSVYAANHGAATIVVVSPDTDVLVLLLHHRYSIAACSCIQVKLTVKDTFQCIPSASSLLVIS